MSSRARHQSDRGNPARRRHHAAVSYEYYDYDRTADRGIPSLNGRPYEVDASTFFGDPDRSPTKATVNIATVVLDHNFSDTVTLRNRTVYGDYNKFYQNVFPGRDRCDGEHGARFPPTTTSSCAKTSSTRRT